MSERPEGLTWHEGVLQGEASLLQFSLWSQAPSTITHRFSLWNSLQEPALRYRRVTCSPLV